MPAQEDQGLGKSSLTLWIVIIAAKTTMLSLNIFCALSQLPMKTFETLFRKRFRYFIFYGLLTCIMKLKEIIF